MPEPDPQVDPPEPPEGDGPDQFTAITSQDDLDRIIGDRLKRERGKYADYDDLKAKAEKFDAAEAANLSDLEKAQAAREAAEKERDSARVEGLRFRIAAKHGISDEDAELFLTGQDEQTLETQAGRLAERETDQKRNGTRSPREGRTPPAGRDEMREFTRELFKTGG